MVIKETAYSALRGHTYGHAQYTRGGIVYAFCVQKVLVDNNSADVRGATNSAEGLSL